MLNIPNVLTIARLIVLPIFMLFAYIDNFIIRIIFLVLYIFAAITDFLDGYIARNFNMLSIFGRIFDPITDKVLIIVVLLTIMVRDNSIALYIFIPTCIIIAREFIVSGLREGLSEQNVVIKVSKLGKYKTASQMVSLGFLIVGDYLLPIIHPNIIGIILLWLATILTLVSGIDYIIKSKNHL